jgi:hypothetical protein
MNTLAAVTENQTIKRIKKGLSKQVGYNAS